MQWAVVQGALFHQHNLPPKLLMPPLMRWFAEGFDGVRTRADGKPAHTVTSPIFSVAGEHCPPAGGRGGVAIAHRQHDEPRDVGATGRGLPRCDGLPILGAECAAMKPYHVKVQAFGVHRVAAELARHSASPVGNRLFQQGFSS